MLIYFDKEIYFPAFGLIQSHKLQRNLPYPEMVAYNTVQLFCNLRKFLIQVQCFYRNLIPTHMIDIVRHNIFLGLCIKQHSGNLMSRSGNCCVFVLHIRKNLVQIPRMKGLYIKT